MLSTECGDEALGYNTIVSYNIDIAGVKSRRHRKFLRKLIMNDKNEDLPKVDDIAGGKFPAADREVLVAE